MLDGQHPHCPFAPHNRHAGEGVELFLARFGAILEFGMGSRLGEVQCLDIGGDSAGQAFPHAHAGNVDSALVQAARGEKFQHAFAQQIDRADFAIQRFADDFDDLIELALRVQARSHDLVQLRKDRTGGSDSTHVRRLTQIALQRKYFASITCNPLRPSLWQPRGARYARFLP